jgi:antitoxin component of RelBE/YafQ-DinJ toxin-antitoxin module
MVSTIQIKICEEDKSKLQKVSRVLGLTLSGFMRMASLEKARSVGVENATD